MFQTLLMFSFPAVFAAVALARYGRLHERLPRPSDVRRWWRDGPALSWFGVNTALVVCLVLVLAFLPLLRWRSRAIAREVAASSLPRLACGCGFEGVLTPALLGRRVQCPGCGRTGRIPAPISPTSPRSTPP
jgi:hypothetical protein